MSQGGVQDTALHIYKSLSGPQENVGVGANQRQGRDDARKHTQPDKPAECQAHQHD